METEDKQIEYKVVLQGAIAEVVEKKSRFIAEVRPVETEEEASLFIEEIRKKYWDARHHCSAFVIGKRGELTRCSDDGEPAGTAGRPILEVLQGENVKNVAVVVTRYFGGTLLGTGGLVRAYGKAAKDALSMCETGWMRAGIRVVIGTDYNGIGKIQYILGKQEIPIEHAEYGEAVSVQVTIPKDAFESCKKEMIEATAGKCTFDALQPLYFIDKNNAL